MSKWCLDFFLFKVVTQFFSAFNRILLFAILHLSFLFMLRLLSSSSYYFFRGFCSQLLDPALACFLRNERKTRFKKISIFLNLRHIINKHFPLFPKIRKKKPVHRYWEISIISNFVMLISAYKQQTLVKINQFRVL